MKRILLILAIALFATGCGPSFAPLALDGNWSEWRDIEDTADGTSDKADSAYYVIETTPGTRLAVEIGAERTETVKGATVSVTAFLTTEGDTWLYDMSNEYDDQSAAFESADTWHPSSEAHHWVAITAENAEVFVRVRPEFNFVGRYRIRAATF